LFPSGYAVCDTPFKKPTKSEFEVLQDIFKDNPNFEIKKIG